MARALDVYLGDAPVGVLQQDDSGRLQFRYSEAWLADAGAYPISHSLPLQNEPFAERECKGFFGGILPEEGPREIIAKNLGITARNDFAMLAEIGGECAGAVSLITGGSTPDTAGHYRSITDAELAEILRSLPLHPLLADEDGVRISLAGAQNKIAVHIEDGVVSIPIGNAPSTHIIKPAIRGLGDSVINEGLCTSLAHELALNVPLTEIKRVEDVDYLLVKRYDRARESDGAIRRLHQEDFCQALGIPANHKYQREGGPSLAQCFDLLRSVSSIPVIDLQALITAVFFNLIIGNNDAHGKNFSLLYLANEGGMQVRLAPLYDLICTVHYPALSRRMAMKIGGEYDARKLLPSHIENLAEEIGMGKAAVRRHLSSFVDRVLGALPEFNGKDARFAAIIESIEGNAMGVAARLG